ncbi:YihY/virulence factor BrkB family protein [Ruegeria arenilitoris]|uniref:YihY/virulence factor BrkB family protein n=1 Tax=Ruegeria arenilitoris TaxID=1173585 RepID=UPI00147DAD04|nr:YihY/virulence factor BrkB family protein [Ruegeria arenilitoris]
MKRILHLMVSTAVRFDRNDGWAHSSHIALSMLLALFPFCIFALSLAGQLHADISTQELADFVLGAWPDDLAEPIEREILAVLEASDTTKITFGAVLAVFFASNGIDAIRKAVSGAYYETDTRPMWYTRLICILFVLFAAFVLSLGGLLTVALPASFSFVEESAPELYSALFSSEILRGTIAVMFLTLLVTASHIWLPQTHRPLRRVFPGVFVTLVLWGICGWGFSIYIRDISTYSATYAGLSGIMATIVFLYFMAAVFILGAEFNAQNAETESSI